jgi:hypothetical protein
MKSVPELPRSLRNPPWSPFFKGGNHISSLWKREVGRDFWEHFSNRQTDTEMENA